MATYFMFGKYSGEALKGLSKARTAQATDLVRDCGGQIEDMYALLGPTDLVIIAEFPSTSAAMKASLALARKTGIGFTTAPAVSVEELDTVIEEL